MPDRRPPAVSPGRALGLTATFVGFQMACSILLAIALMIASGGNASHLQDQLPLTLLVANSLAAWSVIHLELNRQRLSWRFLPPARASFAWMLLPTLLAAAGTTALGGGLTDWIIQWLPSFADASFDMAAMFDLAAHPWLIPLALLVVAPLTEETLFRGLILAGLLRTRSPRAAILISAALFSGMHLNPIQLPATFLIGLTYGWLSHPLPRPLHRRPPVAQHPGPAQHRLPTQPRRDPTRSRKGPALARLHRRLRIPRHRRRPGRPLHLPAPAGLTSAPAARARLTRPHRLALFPCQPLL